MKTCSLKRIGCQSGWVCPMGRGCACCGANSPLINLERSGTGRRQSCRRWLSCRSRPSADALRIPSGRAARAAGAGDAGRGLRQHPRLRRRHRRPRWPPDLRTVRIRAHIFACTHAPWSTSSTQAPVAERTHTHTHTHNHAHSHAHACVACGTLIRTRGQHRHLPPFHPLPSPHPPYPVGASSKSSISATIAACRRVCRGASMCVPKCTLRGGGGDRRARKQERTQRGFCACVGIVQRTEAVCPIRVI